MASTGDVLDLTLREFLEAVASEEPTPGGGSIAALAVATAAGLTAMVARSSPDWSAHKAVAAQAEVLRARVTPLVQLNVEIYEEALVTLRLPERAEPEVRSAAIRGALGRAAEALLLIGEAAADAACLAAEAAECGAGDRRSDAVAAAVLAEAAAKAAAVLVEGNLVVPAGDPRRDRARDAVAAAAEAARRAEATGES